jgi:hypothetical protein
MGIHPSPNLWKVFCGDRASDAELPFTLRAEPENLLLAVTLDSGPGIDLPGPFHLIA